MPIVNQMPEQLPVLVFLAILVTPTLSASLNVLLTLSVPEIWPVLGKNVKIHALVYAEYLLLVM